jgi:class 3 adenylate cyclase/tetratricopeptide (TPR) repeat protein
MSMVPQLANIVDSSANSPNGYRGRRARHLLSAYIPIDRRYALATGHPLPDRTRGAALFADISGFAALSEALTEQLGRQRGTEELTRQLNRVYEALIAQVHSYRGSVVSFVGDAIICWFDQDEGVRAAACALSMQHAMDAFVDVDPVRGAGTTLTIKVGIAAGPVRRFTVGDPLIQVIDVLAGDTLQRMALAEGAAREREVLLDAPVVASAPDELVVTEWRTHPETGDRFAVIAHSLTSVQPAPWPDLPMGTLDEAQIRPWVLPPLRKRLAVGHERFLADLRSTTALFLKFSGIDYDGDDAAGWKLDAYTRWVQEVVDRHGGSLIQLTTGDKGSFFYAAFGAPVAHDDDVARAVKAALSLQTPPEEFEFITGTQIGLAQGQARTGAYGSRARSSYGVIGKDVVLAARLMEAAPPNEMRCSYDVYRHVRNQIAFESLLSIRVKGKAELVRVYRPMGAQTQKDRPGTEDKMVGRQAEVAQLAASLDAIEAGQSRVVIVEAEAGMGKSRLVEELARLARQRGLAGLVGAGQAIEWHTPYRAWRDISAAYFDIEGVTDLGERQRRVEDVVGQVAPDQLLRLPLLNDLLDLDLPDNDLTASLAPELRQQSLALLLIALFRTWTENRPLILVLEDAHWLDSLSWELVINTVRALMVADAPFLLVVVTRPVEENGASAQYVATLESMGNAEKLELSPLSPEEIVGLVSTRLGLREANLPVALADLVCQRAEGNPFFAEELVFALRDQGSITVDESQSPARCIVNENLAQVNRALPDTIQGLVLARIDQLPPEQQLTLKVAAVIGRTFPYAALRHTLQQHMFIADAAIRSHLDQLDTLGLTLVETVKPLTYTFRHIITQDVSYQTLLFAQRRQLHRTVAEWYEAGSREHSIRKVKPGVRSTSRHMDLDLPLLVYHYHQAEDVERERHYAALAGEQAAAQFANAEAVAYLSRALQLTPETAYTERYRILLAREKVFDLSGARESQDQDLEDLRLLAEKLDDDQVRIQIVLRGANYNLALSDYPSAQRCLDTALLLARLIGDERMEVKALIGLGNLTWQQGAYDNAVPWLEEALSLARGCGDREGVATALYELSGVEWLRGNMERASVFATESLALGRQVGDPRGVAEAHNRLGAIAIIERDYEEAGRRWTEVLAIAQEIGDQRNVILGLNNLGYLAHLRKRYEDAVCAFEEALAVSRQIDFRYMVATCLANLGTSWAAMSKIETAWRYLLDGLRESVVVGSVHTTLQCLVSIAWLEAQAGELEYAAELLGFALAHPSLEVDVRQDTAEPILFTLRGVLSVPQLEAALERGKGLDMEQVVARILDHSSP